MSKFIDIINLAPDAKDVPLGDRKNMVYMGSTVVYGRGTAVITATGMDTEMGKIADALSNAEQGQTPLQIKLSQLCKDPHLARARHLRHHFRGAAPARGRLQL